MTPVRKKLTGLFITVILFAYSNDLHAQHLVFLFGHAVYATPTDKNLKEGYNTGLGAEAGAGVGWNKTFLQATIGYSHFFKQGDNSAGDISIVPFKAGLRQYVFSKMIYVHGDLGMDKIADKITSEGRFSGDIGAGIKFAGFEVQLDYDGYTRSNPSGFASWIGFKAGFAIGL